MQVAVAGVEDVGDAHRGGVGEAPDLGQHLRQPGARDDAVLHVVRRADPADRGERRLAALPHERPLGRVLRDARLEGVPRGDQPLDLGELRVDLDLRAVELDDEHRDGARRVAALHGRLGRLDREGVHHLDGGGQDPRGDDVADGAGGVLDAAEADEHRLHRLGHPDRPHGHLGGDAERALAADERAEQVVARVLGRGAAEVHDLAVRQHDLRAHHVVDGEAVLEAVRAAGVLGDVAADAADLLRARVGRVRLVVRRGLPGHPQVDDAGLDDDALVVGPDVDDAAQPRQHEQHAVGHRQRAAGQPGAGPARHEGHAGRGARPDRRHHVVAGAGQHHHAGAHAEVGQPVALVRPQLRRVGEDLVGADPDAQPRGELVRGRGQLRGEGRGHRLSRSARTPAG